MMTSLFRTLAAAGALVLVQTAPASTQDVQQNFEPTADEFRNSCASCHGDDGKGAGWLTRLFKGVDPGDLTQLAMNNEGQFPFDRVFQTIDGRADVTAHGPREMPVWGDRYMYGGQCGIECGPEEMNQLRARARARILELVYYIQSMQQR